jgi:hypothetical protein
VYAPPLSLVPSFSSHSTLSFIIILGGGEGEGGIRGSQEVIYPTRGDNYVANRTEGRRKKNETGESA